MGARRTSSRAASLHQGIAFLSTVDCTCHIRTQAFTKGASEPFTGTLDYIFLGRGGEAPKAGPATPPVTASESEGTKEVANAAITRAGSAWKVLGVKPMKTLSAVEAVPSYPTADEPSDHVLIWADLQLAE
eukprot:scaffold213369_cov36-Tisochrysis_lutea.AAC.2